MSDRPHVRITRMAEGDAVAAAALDTGTGVSPDSLGAELARPWARVWFACDGADRTGVPVAYVVTWIVVDEVHILNLATRADRRREGIGRALLVHVIDDAGRAGCRRLLLEVRRSNRPAIALYRSLRFFVTGLRPRYYADAEDGLDMALDLDPMTHAPIPRADEVDAGT